VPNVRQAAARSGIGLDISLPPTGISLDISSRGH
jgi:hypothetical protein